MVTEDMKLPKIIELPGENRLHVMVEGRLPACYKCRLKGHIKKYPLYILNDMDYVSIYNNGEEDKMQEEVKLNVNNELKM